jgi:2OG-Fe(II) oxygenase superfamily
MVSTMLQSAASSELLDRRRLEAVDAEVFRRQTPFPWLQVTRLLTDEAHFRLRQALPDPSRFSAVFGRRRPYGQVSHDRYVLQYRPGLPLPEPWRAFVAELKGETYRRFVRRLLGHDSFILHFHWHYTPAGCSVSPHCDAPWKLASHIFYLNTEEDWDSAWGGETLILDDEGRFGPRSAPDFEDFPRQMACPAIGNSSLFFLRNEHSWHGVRPILSPDNRLRKVFIVEARRRTPITVVRTFLGF